MYYAGTDGFYVTDGYKATNITGSNLYKSYSDIVKNKADWNKIYGTFDRDNDLVKWVVGDGRIFVYNVATNGFSTIEVEAGYNLRSIKSVPMISENRVAVTDAISTGVDDATHRNYTVDLNRSRYILSGSMIKFEDSGTIYEAEVSSVDYKLNTVNISINLLDSPPATIPALVPLYNSGDDTLRTLLIGTDESIMCESHDNIYSDTYADPAISESTLYGRQPIEFDWLSAGINYGNSASSKWVQFLTVNMKLSTRVSVEPYTVRENDLNTAPMKLISNIEQFKAYDENDIWGRKSARWFPNNIITAKRHLPKGFCRSRFNQMGLRNIDTGLYNSIDYQTVTVVSETSTQITIAINDKEGNPMRFPYDIKGNTIKVKRDSEASFVGKKLKILDQSADRTTLDIVRQPSDPYAVGDVLDWIVFGSPLEQSFEVMGVTMRYADLSDSGDGYKKRDNMENSYGS
jgi:hypothetical protein